MASTPHDMTSSTSKATPDTADGQYSTAPPAQQPTFNILPHPAVRRSIFFLIFFTQAPQTPQSPSFSSSSQQQKSNDPADLQKPSETTGGLRSHQSAFAVTSAPGPVLLNQEMLSNLGPAKVRSSHCFFDEREFTNANAMNFRRQRSLKCSKLNSTTSLDVDGSCTICC